METLKLFIPTSTLNFNNVFSSESISPASFYYKRKFGYKRYSTVAPNPFNNSILLYNKIPKFEINDYENDNYLMIVEINSKYLPEGTLPVYDKDGIKIFQIKNTLYLNPFDVRIHFFSESEKQITLIKSQSSIETKLVDLYSACINIASPTEGESFNWTLDIINEIKDIGENYIEREIEFDHKVDRLKGFLYCYLIGVLKSISPELSELKISFKEVKNLISGIINLSTNLQGNKSTYPRKKVSRLQPEVLNDRLSDLETQIKRFKFFFDKTLQIESLDTEALIKAKYLSDKFDNETIIKILELLKSIRIEGRSIFDHLEQSIKAETFKNNTDYLPNQLIQASNLIHDLVSNSDINAQLNSKIENIVKRLDRIETEIIKIEQNSNSKLTNFDISSCFEIKNLKLSNLNDSFFDRKNLALYHELINTFLDYPIYNVEQFKQERNKLTLITGKLIQNYVDNWDSSEERRYINSLLDNIESYSPFEIKSHRSKTFQSFAAFIMKGEDPDKLLDFLVTNKINDFRIALGLWGSLFGFANMPRTLTKALFNESGIEYLNRAYKWISSQLIGFSFSETAQIEFKLFPDEIYTRSEKKEVQYPKKEELVSQTSGLFNENLLDIIIKNVKLTKQQTKILIDNFNYVKDFPNPRTSRQEFLINLLWKKYLNDVSKKKKDSKKLPDKWIQEIEYLLKSGKS